MARKKRRASRKRRGLPSGSPGADPHDKPDVAALDALLNRRNPKRALYIIGSVVCGVAAGAIGDVFSASH